MTLVVKPCGRGNWAPMRLVYDGPQLAPFTAVVGECFTLGGVLWRVCEVQP